MAFPSARAAVFHISMAQLSVLRNGTRGARRQQSVHRQRYIPCRHQQPPDQHETTDHAADNEVQREQGDPTAQGTATRHDPEAKPPDAERQPAEYP